MHCFRSVTLLGLFLVTLSIIPSFAADPTVEQLDFFETRIRPLLASHCYNCHSVKAEKIKGGLLLDSPEGLLKGGSSGPAIVPGDLEASLIIKAVRYTDPDLQMPPRNQRLSADQIATLGSWVKMGAPLPHSTPESPAVASIAAIRARHWAFQPVRKPVPPRVNNSRWAQTPVDNFILATLEQKGLKPAPRADRRTLIRRITYDLTGLPPTFDEVEAFIKDNRTDAYVMLIDRLLSSPHYGERWGRYWLDVARYADTKGYLAGGEERRYQFSYTYRDYVVRAFNEDKPYDQFLTEQIAADKLSLGDDKRALAALGFLTLGRRFLNNQNDIIDDRIDVLTRGTLGLTVACSRCHDHKFDPIPTRDYYALHGVFASSEEPADKPLLGPLQESPDYYDYLKQKSKIEAEIVEAKGKEVAKFIGDLRQNVGDYLLGARDAARLTDESKFDTFAGERKLNTAILRRWMKDLVTRAQKWDPIFSPWFELAKLPDADFAANAKPLLAKFATDSANVNQVVVKALNAQVTNSIKDAAEAYNGIFKSIDAGWKTSLETATKEHESLPVVLPDDDEEALRQVLYAGGTAINLPQIEAESIIARRLNEVLAPLRNRIEALSWTHPGAPPRAMAMADRATPVNSHVLIRGNPSRPGEEVPRRFLEVLSPPQLPPFTNGSGRLELVRSITSADNPLTARVYVNRVWLHHFGEGIVSTPGDFGVRTPEPLHRPLLDFLAASFKENAWSTKALHRLILLSATYQQKSDAPSASLKSDPENLLLSHMNRQRLDFEALRDTLLKIAGKLDPSIGGLPVDLQDEPFSTRRTLYGLIDRQNLPSVFRMFDFANPDTSNQSRFRTTVPQQALFLMNSPFVIQQAKRVAQRPEVSNTASPAERIQALYRLIFQRPAARAEVELAERFLSAQSHGSANLGPFEKYSQILLLSNEAMFID